MPLHHYFSAPKLRWLLDPEPELRTGADRGELLFGTMDSWITWNLTGGAGRRRPALPGIHVTDVTNASRTMLMNLETLDWDEELLRVFGVPRSMLPRIQPSMGILGEPETRCPAYRSAR